MEITPTIKYVGVDDLDIDLFESQYVVPEGMAYNSYVILDEKVAIMDTVDARKAAEWAEREKQIEQERAEAERVEKIRAKQREEIAAHVSVVDLPEAEQIAVVGLLEGCGKECSLDEVRESIAKTGTPRRRGYNSKG